VTANRTDRVVHRTSQFKSDLKVAMAHRKCDMGALTKAMNDIVQRIPLDAALLDHALRGKYPTGRDGNTDCRECHTSNDWLLVYRYPDDDSVVFIRTGTHSELF
jgi:YafQ family addiction module toxin component